MSTKIILGDPEYEDLLLKERESPEFKKFWRNKPIVARLEDRLTVEMTIGVLSDMTRLMDTRQHKTTKDYLLLIELHLLLEYKLKSLACGLSSWGTCLY